jgi:3'-5' exoribonuclease
MSKEKSLFVKDLKAKDDVESLFLIKHIAVMNARDGRDYLNVILSDSSGDLEGRKWQGAKEVAQKISAGDYVQVKGKVNNFQSRLQLIVNEISKVESTEVEEAHFRATAKNPPDEMFDQLIQIVELLDNVYIKDLLKITLFDSEISRRLKTWQAGKTIHHAYKSGLLEHTLSCASLAATLSEHFGVDKNYVVAGAILHDLCKIYELTDGNVVEYTEEGKLVGHLSKGVELVEFYSNKIPTFPYQIKIHLKHILIAHHGEYSFGSPKVPQTSEALLVHLIDLMDSKLASFETVKKNDNTTGNWSSYVKHLDRIIYKAKLPHYPEYLKNEDGEMNRFDEKKESESFKTKKNFNKNKGQSKNHQKMVSGELKQSMFDKLKDFKVD